MTLGEMALMARNLLLNFSVPLLLSAAIWLTVWACAVALGIAAFPQG